MANMIRVSVMIFWSSLLCGADAQLISQQDPSICILTGNDISGMQSVVVYRYDAHYESTDSVDRILKNVTLEICMARTISFLPSSEGKVKVILEDVVQDSNPLYPNKGKYKRDGVRQFTTRSFMLRPEEFVRWNGKVMSVEKMAKQVKNRSGS